MSESVPETYLFPVVQPNSKNCNSIVLGSVKHARTDTNSTRVCCLFGVLALWRLLLVTRGMFAFLLEGCICLLAHQEAVRCRDVSLVCSRLRRAIGDVTLHRGCSILYTGSLLCCRKYVGWGEKNLRDLEKFLFLPPKAVTFSPEDGFQ